MVTMKKTSLERADFPEQVGVSSKDIKAFIDDIEESNIEVHSFMVLRHGKVAFETWREPYSADMPHTMYSVSKSFTAAAAGFAIDEGYFELDTKVLDIFPEYRPEKPDEKLEHMTIRSLLTMTAGKNVSVLADKSKNQWKKDFFNAPWYADPNDNVWMYISENTYMICSAIRKTTGKSVIEYLTPRLFEPLGFGHIPFWETDVEGTEAGGWGLYITTEDLAKFIRCVHQGGIFNGNQILPTGWAEECVKVQAHNLQYVGSDNRSGYGYFFWRNGIAPNSYRADGMFSQFAIAFDDYDAEFIITSCEIDEQKGRDCIWRHFPAAFIDESDDSSVYEELKPQLFMKPLEDLPEMPHSKFESSLENKIISFKKPVLVNAASFPVSMLPLATVYMSADRAGNIDDVEFKFDGDVCYMTWREGDVTNTITCGMDGKARDSRIHLGGIDFTAHCSACWNGERTLDVWFRPLESVCQRRWRFIFKHDGHVDAIPTSCPDIKTMVQWLANSIDDFIHIKPVASVAQSVIMKGYNVIEPIHKGILTDK